MRRQAGCRDGDGRCAISAHGDRHGGGIELNPTVEFQRIGRGLATRCGGEGHTIGNSGVVRCRALAHGGQHVFARLESGDGLRGGETVGIGCPKLQRALAVGGVATVFGDGRTGAGNGPVLIVLSVLEAAVRYVILGREWR